MKAAVPAMSYKPAVVGRESSDDDVATLDAGLYNPAVAENMAPFLEPMGKDAEYVGIAAFVVFALRYRLRVRAWFHDKQMDLVNEYAPWANEFITTDTFYAAISCNTSEKEGLSLHGHDVESMNHWVASVEKKHMTKSRISVWLTN